MWYEKVWSESMLGYRTRMRAVGVTEGLQVESDLHPSWFALVEDTVSDEVRPNHRSKVGDASLFYEAWTVRRVLIFLWSQTGLTGTVFIQNERQHKVIKGAFVHHLLNNPESQR